MHIKETHYVMKKMVDNVLYKVLNNNMVLIY